MGEIFYAGFVFFLLVGCCMVVNYIFHKTEGVSMFKITEKEIQGDINTGLNVFQKALISLEKTADKIRSFKVQQEKERQELKEKATANFQSIIRAEDKLTNVVATINKIKELIAS